MSTMYVRPPALKVGDRLRAKVDVTSQYGLVCPAGCLMRVHSFRHVGRPWVALQRTARGRKVHCPVDDLGVWFERVF